MKYHDLYNISLGAVKLDHDRYSFRVWAPYCSKVGLKLFSLHGETIIPMQKENEGYFSVMHSPVQPTSRYAYVLDDKKERPDPVSCFQPDGVHSPSCVVDHHDYQWKDTTWKGIALQDIIFYEAHIGTFSPEGTFDGARKKIPYLKELGITCLEIMPIAQFPGKRNWGYDGTGLYAAQNSYGGPGGLKKLVDACHSKGLAVCLDVVYNHSGPEGNYLNDFGPYFTKKYATPWGEAVNYDDKESDHVRRFVIGNALYWVENFHIDALRLDAIHSIYDFSAKHILQELHEAVQNLVQKLKRTVHVIAESDLNDSRIIRQVKQGGYGLSGQWCDDFHHAVHAYLTEEKGGYYEDFGQYQDIVKAIKDGFVYDGKYSSFRKKHHGNSVKRQLPEKLVVCIQNHDQVGNRPFGDRLSALVDFDKQKLAAVLLMLSPYTPLVFMGQEYSEPAPFQYFVDHSDTGLIRAVQEGRKKEFSLSGVKNIPDPKSEKTFLDSALTWDIKKGSPHYYMHLLYKDLIFLRKKNLSGPRLCKVKCDEQNRWLAFKYSGGNSRELFVVISFLDRNYSIKTPFGFNRFHELLNTSDTCYGGKLLRKQQKTGNEIWFTGCGAIVGKGL